jgi:hypothetical protein
MFRSAQGIPHHSQQSHTSHLHILAILPNFLVFLFIFLPFRSLAYAVMTQALATMVEVCLSYPVEHRKSSAAGNKNVTYAV